jgi:hypothetical protein
MSQSEGDTLTLELTPQIRQSEIVTSFVFRKSINSIILSLNHVYDKKIVICPIDKSNWSRTSRYFKKTLEDKGISKEHALQLSDVLDYNFVKILSLGEEEESTEKEDQHQDQTKESKSDLELEKYFPISDEARIPDEDYADFVIDTIKKTVKQEDALVRKIFYTGLSKDFADPTNLAILAPSSEGKTYPIMQAIQYFPDHDVWNYGSMSPKVIIRQKGVLVDSKGIPLDSRITALKKQIKAAEQNHQSAKKIELEEDLRKLFGDAKMRIDLRGKLLIFLEPPHKQTWDILKPILSHDKLEVEHPYVYNVDGRGFEVKNIVTVGWPACIFCSAKNESDWPEWPEIQSRFLIDSPNMIAQKYREGIKLTGQTKGLPKLLQQSLIVSDRDAELARKCVLYLTQTIRKFSSNPTQNPVWIPFCEILGETLPAQKGVDNRIANRLFSLLSIITLSRAHLRGRLVYGNESLTIADIDSDLHELLYITRNTSGIPSFKLRLYKEIVIELFRQKAEQNKDEAESTDITHMATTVVTTRELCNYYNKKTGKSISTNNMKKTYLDEFINNGLINEQDSDVDKRQKEYNLVADLPSSAESSTAFDIDSENYISKIKKLRNMGRVDNILQYSKIVLPSSYKYIPENWLELAFIDLLKCPLQINKFELYNKNNERLCICKFVEEYEQNVKLSEYFSKPVFGNYSSTLFGKMEYLQGKKAKLYGKLSTRGAMDNFFIPKGEIISPYNALEQSNDSNSNPNLDLGTEEVPECEGYSAKSIYQR